MLTYVKVFVITMIILVSCSEKFLDPVVPEDPLTIFKMFWEDLDKHYAFFDIKKEMNWDSVYDAGCTWLKANGSNMSEKATCEFYSEVIKNFYDPHISISFTNFKDDFYNYCRSKSRFESELDSIDSHRIYQWDEYILFTEYIQNYTCFLNCEVFFAPLTASVCYVKIYSFLESNNENDYDVLIDSISKYDFCIFDLRENSGGDQLNVERLCSRLCNKNVLYGYEQFKTGWEHTAFSDPVPLSINPNRKKRYLGHILILINKYTYSGGEFFALAMKESGLATLIGCKTQGFMGGKEYRELPNGWYYTFPINRTLDKNKQCLEEKGIEPHIIVQPDSSYMSNNRDLVLDYTLNYIKDMGL
jgi:hypothetical protein